MSPKRPLSGYSERGVPDTSSNIGNNKANILNFVKFGTVKFSKPREEDSVTQPPLPQFSQSPKQMRNMNSSSYKPSSALKYVVSHNADEELCAKLQKMAGEVSGHLSALQHRHRELGVTKDMSLRVTMEKLIAVSHDLQTVADELEMKGRQKEGDGRGVVENGGKRAVDGSSITPSTLDHPLMLSPDSC